ncbi:hypothetical protein JCM11957_09100 [Caminibacter profundus]
MKKLVYLLPLIFLGCVNNINIDKKLKETSIEDKIIKEYQISKSALTKIDNDYYFYMPHSNGLIIYKLDSNYRLVKKKIIPKLIEGHKLISNKNYIFLIGYDQTKNRPIILKLDKNLEIKSQKYIADKFDIPQDAIINNNSTTVLLLTYKNGADIKLYENGKVKVFEAKQNQFPKFLIKYNGGYLIVGSIQHPQEDLLVVFVKNNKILWANIYDFGMEDTPKKVYVKDKNIVIKLVSQDYMGAEKYITIEINKNGNIIKKEKNLEFKRLPTRFRT